jgi:hypothetical protein
MIRRLVMGCNFCALTMFALPVLLGIAQEGAKQPAKVLEPADYWTAFANDHKMVAWRRALSIYLLFERHVNADITLGKLAELLNQPNWIKEENLGVLGMTSGVLPLAQTRGDTMFVIDVFRNKDAEKHNTQGFRLYMNVSGRIDKNAFYSILMRQGKSEDENRKLKTWAFSPNWDEYTAPLIGAGQQQPKQSRKLVEPADYWTAVANDEKLVIWRRGVSIYFLFERHMRPDMTLNELADLLNKPTWIKEEHVWPLEGPLTGASPVVPTPGDSLFRIVVFYSKDVQTQRRETIGIYIKVSGKVDKKTFLSIIMKEGKNEQEKNKVKGWGFNVDLNEYVRRTTR